MGNKAELPEIDLNNPEVKKAIAALEAVDEYRRKVKDNRPVLVGFDQPVTNTGVIVKYAAITALVTGAVVAGNEISRKIHK